VRERLDSYAEALVAGHVEQVIDNLLKRLPVNMPAQGLRNLADRVIVRRRHSEAPSY
jgi:hypothetical protein